MLTLVLRRARVQRRLLLAVVVLVAAAASLVGVCSSLLGETQDRAFRAEVGRTAPADVDVTAFLVDLSGADLDDARQEARDVVDDVLAPLDPTVTSSATGRMRRLGDSGRLGYLATGDDLPGRAELTSGRWPAAGARAAEAVVPEAAARLLELDPGDVVTLGSEIGLDGVDTGVRVEVVGTYRPRAGTGWESDPLSGAGSDPAYSDGSVTAPAYGPFLVEDAAFSASGSSVSGLRVTGHPTLALADDASLRAAVASLDRATALLSARVGDRARIVRVASDLDRTLTRFEAQQTSTRATVLVVLLLGAALSLTAVTLAGWLVAAVREAERSLLTAMGLSRRQQVGAAAVEALLVGTLATVLAVPAAAWAHARLTHLPDLEAAGLAQRPSVTAALVVTVLAGAVLLAAALVAATLDVAPAPDPTARRWAAVRSGLDAVLVAVAAVGWWQLRSRPAAADTGGDVTLTLAPVLFVGGLTVVAVRVVPLLLSGAARLGVRSRSLVLPLAAQQAARRPHTGTTMVLLAAAVASAVLGLGLRATWDRSQDDQAALRVGTDLALTLAAPAVRADADAVGAAVADQAAVSAVASRPVVLGRYLGEPGSPPLLVALDSRHAGDLLRGRLGPGTSWDDVGETLRPGASVTGLVLPEDGQVELTASAPGGGSLTVRPTAVVQDATGFRAPVPAEPVALDGRPHRLEWLGPLPGRLVALRLELDGAPPREDPDAAVSVTLAWAGAAPDTQDWPVRALGRDTPVHSAVAEVRAVDGRTELEVSTTVDLAFFAYTGADLVVTSFAAPPAVPVAVSEELADAVGARVGGELSATVGGAAVPLRVTAVVPAVPSAPGRAGVLADADTLSRVLLAGGRLDPVVDGWWVADPTPHTERALRDLGLGEVTTRDGTAAELRQGPLRVTGPAALLTLVAAAVTLLLAGVALLLGAERQRRLTEVARLRALGASARDARRLLLVEHAAFLVPLLVVGALVGALATVLLGPHLVRSDLGAAPVPDAVVVWPWVDEALLLGGVLLAALALAALVGARHVARSDPAHLRAGEG